MNSQPPGSRLPRAGTLDEFGIAHLLLAFAACFQVALASSSLSVLVGRVLSNDDAYYYFRVARALAATGEATFDGLHETNGVQLAWTAILAVLARFVGDETLFLRAALVLGTALNVVVGVGIGRFGTALHSRTLGASAVVLWSGKMIAERATSSGMELALHMAVIVACAAVGWLAWRVPASLDLRDLAAGLLLLALNAWVRLDAALFSAALWLVLARSCWRRPPGRARRWGFVLLVLIPVAAAAAYVATCWSLGGTPAPISGAVKSLYTDRHFDGLDPRIAIAGHGYWWISILSRTALGVVHPDLAAEARLERPWLFAVAVAALAVVVSAVGRIASTRCGGRDARVARALLVAMALGAVHAAAVVLVVGPFSHVVVRYYGWLTLSFVLAVSLLVARWRPSVRAFGLASAAWFVAWLPAATRQLAEPLPGGLHVRRLALADRIRRELPPDVKIGAWNAGALGYFCGRTVVNLDGLVNNREYLAFLRARRPVGEYLEREGIEYLADYDDVDLTMPYRAEWDSARRFRGAIEWRDLEVLYSDDAPSLRLYLVRFVPRRGK